MAIQKQLAFIFLAIFCTESLSTREPMNLLNTTQQLSHRFPFMDVTDHHIATAYFSDDAVSVKTYSLKGQELTSCEAPRVWPNGQVYIGGIASLRNNETLVFHWINTDLHFVSSSIVSVMTLNTTNCRFTYQDISASLISFENEVGMRSFVVPYENNFDLVFENRKGEIMRIMFEANGLSKNNMVKLAEIESSSTMSIGAVSKYSHSEGYLAIYRIEEDFAAIVIDSDAKSVKRKILLQTSEDSRMLNHYSSVTIGGDYGKLVFCSCTDKTVECTRYNTTTLETEMSTQIEVTKDQVVPRIYILPDGGFWIWAMLISEDDSGEFGGMMKSSLTKVSSNGQVEETFEITHCILNYFSILHMYHENGKLCVVFNCESVDPLNSPNNWLYSTQSTCY